MADARMYEVKVKLAFLNTSLGSRHLVDLEQKRKIANFRSADSFVECSATWII